MANNIQPQPEVIVVGAGPAGAAVAIYLARQQRRVLLLEGRDFSHSRPADMRSGEVLSPLAQLELKNLGLNFSGQDWTLLPFKVLNFFWPNGRVTFDLLPEGLEFVQIYRGGFDRALFKLARENGVLARDNSRVKDLLRTSTGHICGVITRGGDKPDQEFKAPLVVDASGRRSPLLARLKLKKPELEIKRIALVCFYKEMAGCQPGVWEQHFLGKFNTVLKGSKMKEGLYRFSFETDLVFRDNFAARNGKLTPHEMVLSMLKELNPPLFERFKAAKPLPYSVAYAPIAYRVPQIVHPGLIMVGDSAGYLDPSTGQGIEFALRTARQAAKTINRAFSQNDLKPENFSSYLEGRRKEIESSSTRLRLYLRLSQSRNLLNLFSYLPPGRRIFINSLIKEKI